MITGQTTIPSRWVLVTGGSRGIGKGIVEHLCRRGHDVAFTYKASAEAAHDLATGLFAAGLRCEAVECDGTDESSVRREVAKLVSRKGPPQALINNMGLCRDVTLPNMEESQWRTVIDTNLGSMFRFTHEVIRGMIERRDGVVLQISSVTGMKGVAGQCHYAASKAGMMGFTRSLALEVARFNIRVNAVAPGFIDTDMLGQIPEARRESLSRLVPLRRVGQVSDVTGLIEFLLSEQAGYITGQTLVVDGGLLA